MTMNPEQRRQVCWGLAIMAGGLIAFAAQWPIWVGIEVDLATANLWPLILVAIGLARLLWPGRDGRSGGGMMLLFLGALFLMHTQQMLSLRQSWPLFIVAAGLSMAFGGRKQDAGPGSGRGTLS